jgi:hypothetical protein
MVKSLVANRAPAVGVCSVRQFGLGDAAALAELLHADG